MSSHSHRNSPSKRIRTQNTSTLYADPHIVEMPATSATQSVDPDAHTDDVCLPVSTHKTNRSSHRSPPPSGGDGVASSAAYHAAEQHVAIPEVSSGRHAPYKPRDYSGSALPSNVMTASSTAVTRHRRTFQSRRNFDTSRGQGKVSYMCVADSIDLSLIENRYLAMEYQCERDEEVLHVTNVKGYGSTISTTEPIARFDLFVFAYGSVVWWGTDIDTFRFIEREFFLMNPSGHSSSLPRETFEAIQGRYSQTLLDEYFPGWCVYTVSESEEEDPISSGKFQRLLQRDHLLLQSDRPAFKQTISHALAQSAKLDVIEPLVSQLLKACHELPMQVSIRGRADISDIAINKLRGELFQYRMVLRDVLDEPDFFWEYSWFAPLYNVLREDYQLEERVSVLDEKLSVVHEILEMLSTQFSLEHGWRLEWIMIILIFAAVFVAAAQLYIQISRIVSHTKK